MVKQAGARGNRDVSFLDTKRGMWLTSWSVPGLRPVSSKAQTQEARGGCLYRHFCINNHANSMRYYAPRIQSGNRRISLMTPHLDCEWYFNGECMVEGSSKSNLTRKCLRLLDFLLSDVAASFCRTVSHDVTLSIGLPRPVQPSRVTIFSPISFLRLSGC